MNTADTHRTTSLRSRRAWRIAAIAVAGTALLAACGGDDDDAASTQPATASAAEATTPAPPATTARSGYADDYGYADTPATDADGTAAQVATPTGAATVSAADTSLGAVLVDADGMTLYAFTEDADGEPTCVEGCADAWPPAHVEGELTLADLDEALFSTVEHPTGTQLKAGDWPLYTFAGDSAPGDVNGQGSGGSWFVVAPDGTLVK